MEKDIFSQVEREHSQRSVERQRQQQEFQELTKSFMQRVIKNGHTSGAKYHIARKKITYKIKNSYTGDWSPGSSGYFIDQDSNWFEDHPGLPKDHTNYSLFRERGSLKEGPELIKNPLELFTLNGSYTAQCFGWSSYNENAIERLPQLPDGTTAKVLMQLGDECFRAEIDLQAIVDPARLGAQFLVGLLHHRNQL